MFLENLHDLHQKTFVWKILKLFCVCKHVFLRELKFIVLKLYYADSIFFLKTLFS